MGSMDALSNWLYTSSFSHLLQTEVWIITLIQTVHIVCLAALFTSMAMLDLRLLGIAGRQHSISSFAQRFLPWLWGTLPILLITGLMLVTAEPTRDLHNFAFYLKMSMIIVASLITLGFQYSLKKDPKAWDLSSRYRLLGKTIAVVSLALWMSVIVAGRLIAYT